jgi:ribosomal protein S14
MIAWVLSLLVPSALWALAHVLSRRTTVSPSFAVHGVAGFLAPAGLLRWCGRPFPEQLIAWVVSVVAWAGAFVIRDAQVFIAFGLVGAVWGLALGLQTLRLAEPKLAQEANPEPEAKPMPAPRGESQEAGFSLELPCPTCGAALAVPVYHRMSRCEFCGSVHVVSGRSDTLEVVIPDAVTDEAALKGAVLKHLGHRRYLALYDQRVRPLISDSGPTPGGGGDEPGWLTPEQTPALVNAAEAEVARAAEAYAAGLAPRLAVTTWHRFLAPYWHRFGTLYQAAFGREKDGTKRMEFAVATIEGSVAASRAPLPPMGKLSYLRALRPLVGSRESKTPALAVELDRGEIDRRALELDHRAVGLEVKPIAIHATFVPEVVALVYRPWHLATVELDGERSELLVDGGAARVEGEAPAFDFEARTLADLAAEVPTLAPSRCPECGADLPFVPDADAHLCRNCYRLVTMRGNRWVVVPYLHEEVQTTHWQVPFWRFPVRLRTASGELIVDLPHLADGIDGTYDQIGDRPQVQQEFFVPAFRTTVSRAGVRLYRRLWPLRRGRSVELSGERFGPARPPDRVVEITLPAPEARVFARVYLALAFTERDLARAVVRTVRERFLTCQLEGEPELVYLNLSRELVDPFQSLFGRARLAALEGIEGGPSTRS